MTDDMNAFDSWSNPNLPKRRLIGWSWFVIRFHGRAPLDVLMASKEAKRYHKLEYTTEKYTGKLVMATTVV
jgi:hypothetical protein